MSAADAESAERAAITSPERTAMPILLGIVVLAALLRFSTLDLQSYWFDETVTVVDVLRPSLLSTIERVPSQELAPPLYSGLAWLWSRPFGAGEVGLRSLSALLGTALVPVAYATARRLATERAGLIAAALAAANPLLVWYSQEARHYSLLALMATLTVLCFARALRDPSRAALWWWAAACAGALATHYFAAFLIAPQAIWLLWASRRRPAPTILAAGAVAAVGAALLPLALHQRSSGGADWIAAIPAETRVRALAEKFLAGWPGADNPAWPVVLVLVAVAAWALLRRADDRERRGAAVALGLAAGALAIPAAMALGGSDFIYYRHLIVALPPLLIGLGIAFGAARAGRAGLAAAGTLCLVWIAISVAVALVPRYQRDDWRGAADALGPAREARAVVVNPVFSREPLQAYGHPLRPLGERQRIRVSEIALVGTAGAVPPPPAGFRLVERRSTQKLALIRYRAPAPQTFTPATLAAELGTVPLAVTLERAR